MRSTTKEIADGFDLERDLRLTEADIEALDRARKIPPLDFEKYLRWLEEITTSAPARPELSILTTPFAL